MTKELQHYNLCFLLLLDGSSDWSGSVAAAQAQQEVRQFQPISLQIEGTNGKQMAPRYILV
ncbi:hypothetical protein HOF92_05730 [bacterium]|jgi:hypothetical protein|nr:hypothetical protein [bacterium]